MNFSLLLKPQDLNQFKWKYQNKKIQIVKNDLRSRPGILKKLEKSISFINETALFIPPPISSLIEKVII
jgi:hypothetical protein